MLNLVDDAAMFTENSLLPEYHYNMVPVISGDGGHLITAGKGGDEYLKHFIMQHLLKFT